MSAPAFYRFTWGATADVWNEKRRTLRGRLCRILAVGARNSVLVEFADTGQREIVSRRALRRDRPPGEPA